MRLREPALGHARAGERTQIGSYLGSGDRLECAIADFTVACADQTRREHPKFTEAVTSSRIDAYKLVATAASITRSSVFRSTSGRNLRFGL